MGAPSGTWLAELYHQHGAECLELARAVVPVPRSAEDAVVSAFVTLHAEGAGADDRTRLLVHTYVAARARAIDLDAHLT